MAPLAYRMRPQNIDEIVGQQHLVGKNKIIQRMVNAKLLSSMILYGPPGVGKTSIASAIAGSTKYAFRKLNAATDSKKELTQVVAETKISGTVILMLDEIQRLTKPNQDLLLPYLEDGSIILIGATTENLYITISPAIRSRAQIFEVKPLSPFDIKKVLQRALTDKKRGFDKLNIDITNKAIDYLANTTNGDLRNALNSLELAVRSTTPDSQNIIRINMTTIIECTQKTIVADKNSDAHYDIISALQKSIRGSDVDAALHYLARLIVAGDLPTITRRLTVIVYEDIGLGNPQAAARTVAAINAAERLGFPEAKIPLSVAVIDLCLSPKSNSALTAISQAINDVEKGNYGTIPNHLKDAHYHNAAKLGRGNNYQYPHDFPHDWVNQQYLPDKLKDKHYYYPKLTGRYERALAEQLQRLNSAKQNDIN